MSCGSDSDASEEDDQICNTLDYTIVNGVLNGSLFLRSQNDINEFDWSCIHTITGSLHLATVSPSFNEPISDITSLSVLKQIGGLVINDNLELTSIQSLENIDSFHPEGSRKIIIDNNPQITTLDGLQNLPGFASELNIFNNSNLTNLSAINQMTKVDVVGIKNNDALTSLMGIHNIDFANRISISGNDSLTNLVGIPSFDALQSIELGTYKIFHIGGNISLESLEGVSGNEVDGIFTIKGHPNLISLSPLSGLTRTEWFEIEENELIESLNGLESLILVDGPLEIRRNDNLSDFCAITNLVTNGQLGNSIGVFGTSDNAYNPTLDDLQMGNCSN